MTTTTDVTALRKWVDYAERLCPCCDEKSDSADCTCFDSGPGDLSLEERVAATKSLLDEVERSDNAGLELVAENLKLRAEVERLNNNHHLSMYQVERGRRKDLQAEVERLREWHTNENRDRRIAEARIDAALGLAPECERFVLNECQELNVCPCKPCALRAALVGDK